MLARCSVTDEQVALVVLGVMAGMVLAIFFFGASVVSLVREMRVLIKELRLARRNTPNPEG